MSRSPTADRLAGAAIAFASIAALAGLVLPDIYRDAPVLVEATKADNLFQLVAVAPLGVAASIAARRGAVHGRLVVAGVLMYLAYFFGLYAVAGAVNALTLAHVVTTGLAVWAIVLGLPATDAAAAEDAVGSRLFRRTTIVFLLVVAGFHIPLWTSQILAAVASNLPPAGLVTYGWLNTPVYTFDLAFALPLGIVAAVFLARRDPRGSLLAVPFVWFSLLLAGDMFFEQVWLGLTGSGVDVSQAAPFGLIAVASAAVVTPLLVRRSPRHEMAAAARPA